MNRKRALVEKAPKDYKLLWMAMPFIVITLPAMMETFVIKSYGLLNNFWVYILPTMISAYNMILIKTYIEQLPPALEESAALDGAGYITCFFKIILPLCKPIIATVVVFVAVGQWNSCIYYGVSNFIRIYFTAILSIYQCCHRVCRIKYY